MSLEDLNAIRAITDVGVAAPIGLVGTLRPMTRSVDLTLSTVKGQPIEAFRMQIQSYLNDGVKPKLLVSNELSVQSDPNVDDATPSLVTSGASASGGDPVSSVSVIDLPMPATSIVAIDPEAERKLLGQAGSFLDPLEKAQKIPTDNSTYALPELSKISTQDTTFLDYLAFTSPEGDPFFPVLVNEVAAQEVSADIKATQIKPVEFGQARDFSDLAKRSPEIDSATATHDVSSAFVPFLTPPLNFPVPGARPSGDSGVLSFPESTLSEPFYAAPPVFEQIPGDGCVLRATASGAVAANGEAAGNGDGYSEQTYREQIALPPAHKKTAIPLPIGTYNTASLKSLNEEASYVPLGAYEEGATEVYTGEQRPSAEQKAALKLLPGLSGRGLTVGSPGALTTLEGGKQLRGEDSIDAIRIRVAGVDSYSEESKSKIAHVATQIQDLGFAVTVMAGSSRDAVDIFVPEYHQGPDASGEDLGWIRQQWSSLDAAARVNTALDAGGATMLWYVIGSALLLGFVATLIQKRSRRAEYELLGELGWSRRRRLWWLGSGNVIGLACLTVTVAIVSIASAKFSIANPLLLWIIPIVLLAYVASTLLSLQAALPKKQQQPKTARTHRFRAKKIATASRFGMTLARRRPLETAAQIIAVAISAIGAGLAFGVFQSTVINSGTTMLASESVEAIAPLHLGLAALGLATSFLLLVVIHKAGRAERTQLAQQLRGLGWNSKAQARWMRAETLPLGFFGLLVGTLSSLLLASLSGFPLAALLAGSFTGAAVAVLILFISKTLSARGTSEATR